MPPLEDELSSSSQAGVDAKTMPSAQVEEAESIPAPVPSIIAYEPVHDAGKPGGANGKVSGDRPPDTDREGHTADAHEPPEPSQLQKVAAEGEESEQGTHQQHEADAAACLAVNGTGSSSLALAGVASGSLSVPHIETKPPTQGQKPEPEPETVPVPGHLTVADELGRRPNEAVDASHEASPLEYGPQGRIADTIKTGCC